MSAKDARNLELAVRELTAELKRQRGVDPDASIADKPRRLTETPIHPGGVVSGGYVGTALPGGDTRFLGSPSYIIPQATADRLGISRLGDVQMDRAASTGYSARSMEILREAMEDGQGA